MTVWYPTTSVWQCRKCRATYHGHDKDHGKDHEKGRK